MRVVPTAHPFVASPCNFSLGPPLTHFVGSLLDALIYRVVVALQGVLKGLLAMLKTRRPPFVHRENSPTLWPVQQRYPAITRGFCLHANQGPLLSQDGCHKVAPLKWRAVRAVQ
jgi:hypothetical protein